MCFAQQSVILKFRTRRPFGQQDLAEMTPEKNDEKNALPTPSQLVPKRKIGGLGRGLNALIEGSYEKKGDRPGPGSGSGRRRRPRHSWHGAPGRRHQGPGRAG